MFIDKVEPFYTDDERDRMNELGKAMDNVLEQQHGLAEQMKAASRRGDETTLAELRAEASEIWRGSLFDDINREMADIRELARYRYIRHFKHEAKRKAAILSDIIEVVDATEKAEFPWRVEVRDPYSVFVSWLWMRLRPQVEALDHYGFSKKSALDVVLKKATLYFGSPKEEIDPEKYYAGFSYTPPADSAPNVQGRRPNKILYGTDKLSQEFFDSKGPKKAMEGQQRFVFTADQVQSFDGENAYPITLSGADKRNKKDIVGIFFNHFTSDEQLKEFGISAEREGFDSVDLSLEYAWAALWLAGNRKVTAYQVIDNLPGKRGSSPNAKQAEKAKIRLLRQIATNIGINTRLVSEKWNKATYNVIFDQLLPGRYVQERMTVNGKLVTEYFEIRGMPPLLQFADDIRQISAIDSADLECDIPLIPAAQSVFWWCIRQLRWMKNPNKKDRRSNLLTYDELYAAAGANRSDERKAARGYLSAVLKRQKALGKLSDFKETEKGETPGVRVHFPRNAIEKK